MSSPIDELQKIKGIGPRTAEKLVSKGIAKPEDIVVMMPQELASILGTSIAKAKEIINNAKEVLISEVLEIWTGEKLKNYVESEIERIPTGISALDKVIDGGIPTNAVHGIAGASATGKTEMCYSIAVNAVKHLRRPFIWIETEPGTFSISRLLEIANARGVDIDISSDMYVVPAKFVTNPAMQMVAYEMVDRKAEEMDVKPAVLVVDSFTAKIREYFVGREMLSARSQEVARHLGYLQLLASKYNMAVVLTEQVYGVPDIGMQRVAAARFGDIRVPYGGEFMLHSVTYHFTLVRVGASEWEVVLSDIPGKPMLRIPFRITEAGVTDA